MITIIEVFIILMSAFMMNMTNPVKMSLSVLALGASILILTSKTEGMIWMNMILYLLFMGGILVVFMIISSMSPNENPLKIKKLIFVPFLGMSLVSMSANMEETTKSVSQLKCVMFDGKFLSGVILIMTLYFFLFIKILNSTKMSMRTFV